MRYTMRIYLFLLILGIIFVGSYLKLDSKMQTERYTGSQTVETLMEPFDDRYSSHERNTIAETLYHGTRHVAFTSADAEAWVVIGENALPQVPGRIYVQKTESTANIWHTARTVANSEAGGGCSIEGSELSERQRLNLLNTGTVPKGWEVVYVDGDGNPICKENSN